MADFDAPILEAPELSAAEKSRTPTDVPTLQSGSIGAPPSTPFTPLVQEEQGKVQQVPFDPSKPFTAVQAKGVVPFDPSKPFEAGEAKPEDLSNAGAAPTSELAIPADSGTLMKEAVKGFLRKAEPSIQKTMLGIGAFGLISPQEMAGGPSPLTGATSAQARMDWLKNSPDPLLQWARQAPEESAKKFPAAPGYENLFTTQAGEAAGSFAAPLASGPFAPFVIGAQNAGERLTGEYDQLVKAGTPAEAAAQQTFQHATREGLTDEIIWGVLPPILREAGDKYLIDKFGTEGVKRFILGRVANVGEGAALGAVTRIGENTATGDHMMKGVGEGAAGLGALFAITPRGKTLAETENEVLTQHRLLQEGAKYQAFRPKLSADRINVVAQGHLDQLDALGAKATEEQAADRDFLRANIGKPDQLAALYGYQIADHPTVEAAKDANAPKTAAEIAPLLQETEKPATPEVAAPDIHIEDGKLNIPAGATRDHLVDFYRALPPEEKTPQLVKQIQTYLAKEKAKAPETVVGPSLAGKVGKFGVDEHKDLLERESKGDYAGVALEAFGRPHTFETSKGRQVSRVEAFQLVRQEQERTGQQLLKPGVIEAVNQGTRPAELRSDDLLPRPEAKAEAPFQPGIPANLFTGTPEQAAHLAPELLKAPLKKLGASFLRTTDKDGRVSTVSIANLDTLKDAGPFEKVEAGTKSKGKFLPIDQPITFREAPQSKAEASMSASDIEYARKTAELQNAKFNTEPGSPERSSAIKALNDHLNRKTPDWILKDIYEDRLNKVQVAKALKGTGPTPAQKALQIEIGKKYALKRALNTGIVPDFHTLHTWTGDATAGSEAAKELTAELAKAYPPQKIPANTKLIIVNHEAGIEYPTAELPTGEVDAKGKPILKMGAPFMNNDRQTAAAFDAGKPQIVPQSLILAKKVNPAIAFDKDTGKVIGVMTKYGFLDKPGTLTDLQDKYLIAQREKFAGYARGPLAERAAEGQQGRLTGEEDIQVPEELGQVNEDIPQGKPEDLIAQYEAEERERFADIADAAEIAGVDPTTITHSEEPPPGGKAMPARPQLAEDSPTTTAKTHFENLTKAGLIQNERLGPNAVGTFLKYAATSKDVPKWLNFFAQKIIDSGLDTSKLTLKLINNPNDASGWYVPTDNYERADIQLNLGNEGYSGTYGTIIHEVFHHILEPLLAAKRNGESLGPIRDKALQNLIDLRDEATKQALRQIYKMEPTETDIRAFQAIQEHGVTVPEEGVRFEKHPILSFFGDVSEVIKAFSDEPTMEMLASMKPDSRFPRAPTKLANLLHQIVSSIKSLFFNEPETKEDTLWAQMTNEMLTLMQKPYESAERAGPKAESKAKKIAGFDWNSLADIIAGPEKPETTTEPLSSGWLSPTGEHLPSAGEQQHAETAMSWIDQNDPAASEKLDLGSNHSAIYNHMFKKGFVRVAGGAGFDIYIEGKPNTAQIRILKDEGTVQKVGVIQDLPGNKTKVLYSPENKMEAAKPAEKPGGRIARIVRATGVSHELRDLDPDASWKQLDALDKQIDANPAISDKDRASMKQGINAAINNLQPSISVPVKKTLDKIVVGYDSANTIANVRGRQARNSVRLDFANEATADTDRSAMPFVVEAGGDIKELQRDLDRVTNSKDKELTAQYTPIIQHAIDNFDRLNALKTGYETAMKAQLEREKLAGLDVGELDRYVTRILEAPQQENEIIPGGKGLGKYFMKGRSFEKLSDAIAEGYAPKEIKRGAAPTDIAELAAKRIEAGERLVQMKLLEDELKTYKAPDGKPIIGKMDEYESIMGKKETGVPAGYDLIQTGGKPLVVHSDIAPVFKALYGDSSIPEWVKASTGFVKRNTLVFDTYHVGRIMFKELAYSKGAERIGYGKGLSILEYAPEDIARAVKAGEISQDMADYANANRDIAEGLLKNALNVGKVSDNLFAELSYVIPSLEKFNPWVFQKLSRGAMLQTAIENFKRNQARFPERGDAENLRQTAKEYNEVFGNLQNQGLFKSKNFQDAARTLFLAPNWAESQLRAELRGYGQAAKAPIDIAQGKFRLGTVAQGQATIVLGMLAANQVVNFLSTGHSTFQNPESHKLEAWIPGGKYGFYFNPFTIGAEYAYMATRYFSQHMNPVDIAGQILANKLAPIARGAKDLATGRDWSGRPYLSGYDRIRGALVDTIPIPIVASSILEKDPRQTLGYRLSRQPGSLEKQGLQAVGMKVYGAPGPRTQMYALAQPFRQDKGYIDNAGEYTELRRALDNDQLNNAKSEIWMLAQKGKTPEEIKMAVGVSKAGTIRPEHFAGTAPHEADFKRTLTPDQKEIYAQAQKDHIANAKKLLKLMPEMREELKEIFKTNEYKKKH